MMLTRDLKTLRNALKMTQPQFARALGVPLYRVRNWTQQATTEPSQDVLDRLVKLCDNHGIDVREIEGLKAEQDTTGCPHCHTEILLDFERPEETFGVMCPGCLKVHTVDSDNLRGAYQW